jgi:4-hydroxybenzoate polyprenyltransferase
MSFDKRQETTPMTKRTAPVKTLRPGLPNRLLGLLLATHPVPSAMYVVMTAFLAFVAASAAHRPLDPAALVRVLIAVGAAQIAIGSLNDYRDRELDAGRPDKPIPLGLIAPWHALALCLAASVVMLLSSIPLGPLAFVLCLLIEGLGLAYDLWFKGSPISALLFAAYFPLFPLLAWTVFGRWQPFLPWLLPFGALLGVAMNVANSLPDLEADRAAGVRGLPHLLGLRRGLAVAWGTPPLVFAGMLTLALTGIVPARLPGMLVAAAGALLSVLAAMLLYRANPQPATLRRTFLIQGVGVLLLAGGWIAAVAFY